VNYIAGSFKRSTEFSVRSPTVREGTYKQQELVINQSALDSGTPEACVPSCPPSRSGF